MESKPEAAKTDPPVSFFLPLFHRHTYFQCNGDGICVHSRKPGLSFRRLHRTQSQNHHHFRLQTMNHHQIPHKIKHEIIDSGRDIRYTTEAYLFVLSGLEFYLTRLGEKKHVTGQELSLGLLDFAHKQFGPLSRSVFSHWGINATDDLGYIVYNLIAIGVMSKQPEDKLDDFFRVTDIDQFFKSREYYEIDKNFIKRINGA